MANQKNCPCCKLTLPLHEFVKNRTTKTGIGSYCRKCCAIKTHLYRASHKEKIHKYKQEYGRLHQKEIQQYNKQYRDLNRDLLIAKEKAKYNNPKTDKQMVKKIGGNLYWVYSGNKYVHTVIAENTLGRKFKKGEVVHHVDKNGLNNNHDNLLIYTQGFHKFLHHQIKRNLRRK